MNLFTEHNGLKDLFGVGTNESVLNIFFEVFDFSDTNFSFKTSQFSTDSGAEGTENLLKYFLNIIPLPKVTGVLMTCECYES